MCTAVLGSIQLELNRSEEADSLDILICVPSATIWSVDRTKIRRDRHMLSSLHKDDVKNQMIGGDTMGLSQYAPVSRRQVLAGCGALTHVRRWVAMRMALRSNILRTPARANLELLR